MFRAAATTRAAAFLQDEAVRARKRIRLFPSGNTPLYMRIVSDPLSPTRRDACVGEFVFSLCDMEAIYDPSHEPTLHTPIIIGLARTNELLVRYAYQMDPELRIGNYSVSCRDAHDVCNNFKLLGILTERKTFPKRAAVATHKKDLGPEYQDTIAHRGVCAETINIWPHVAPQTTALKLYLIVLWNRPRPRAPPIPAAVAIPFARYANRAHHHIGDRSAITDVLPRAQLPQAAAEDEEIGFWSIETRVFPSTFMAEHECALIHLRTGRKPLILIAGVITNIAKDSPPPHSERIMSAYQAPQHMIDAYVSANPEQPAPFTPAATTTLTPQTTPRVDLFISIL